MIRYVMTVLAVAMHDRKGITALEYGVLAAAIIGAVTVAAANLGTAITNEFIKLGSDL